jgi:S-(hydroxymethyl)glutathione dehydrogenase / alcohol dehydrogenase
VSSGVLSDGGTRLSQGGRTVYRGVGLGGFAEQVIAAVSTAVKVPDDTPLEIACLLGCAVQTGVGAVLNTARVAAGDTVAVVGLGGVGISAVQGARLAGASRIIGVDPVATPGPGSAVRGDRRGRFGVAGPRRAGGGDH